jgi:hypothetical protein
MNPQVIQVRTWAKRVMRQMIFPASVRSKVRAGRGPLQVLTQTRKKVMFTGPERAAIRPPMPIPENSRELVTKWGVQVTSGIQTESESLQGGP